MPLEMNELVAELNKPAVDFTREDILKIVKKFDVEIINFRYTGIDGQLKELKLPVNNKKYLQKILVEGERVDGSSLFKKIVEVGFSDLYVVPMYRLAFLNPFHDGVLDICCQMYDKNGDLSKFVPENILYNSYEKFKNETGYTFEALGELEFFIIYDNDDPRFPSKTQKNYHVSSPYAKNGELINDITTTVARMTSSVKYCHSEVGYIDNMRSRCPELDGKRLEQYELEFLPTDIHLMSYYLPMAKWAIRNVAYEHGANVTFAPKIREGAAGNGLHVHMQISKNGVNQMTGDDGKLSKDARKLIGGLIGHTQSLVAFGNTSASSFFRLVPNQEAPTKVCWSDSNRSSLIRVPLGWNLKKDLEKLANPKEKDEKPMIDGRQTVEIRNADSTAYVGLLLAGLTLAANEGLKDDKSLDVAEKHYVVGNIFKDEKLLNSLPSLPANCGEAAIKIKEDRKFYEADGIFPETIIDYIIHHLNCEQNYWEDIHKLPENEMREKVVDLLHKDIHIC